MRACDEEDGRPNHQVSRFQPMAPMSAAATDDQALVPCGRLDDALADGRGDLAEAETVTPPSRLATAAIARATRGVRARVETEVAIALAASWKPLV